LVAIITEIWTPITEIQLERELSVKDNFGNADAAKSMG
jgi:hypothetical protein